MNKDDMKDDAGFDAEFESFLNGEGDLARRLQGLAQPAPSAALDAAILANARAAMAQDGPPAAANDSGDATPAARLAPGLGWRWRIPAGIAATVLVGVFANQTFQSGGELNEVVVPVVPASAVAPPAVVLESPPAQETIVQDQARPRESLQRRAPAANPVRAEPAPVAVESTAAAPLSAPVAAPRPAADLEKARSYNRIEAAPQSKAGYAPAPAPAPVPMSDSRSLQSGPMEPGPWLDWIEKLLERGDKAEALDQWAAFRAAHPDYLVPAATREKLE